MTKKIFYLLTIGAVSFFACVGIVQATQTFTEDIAVPSIKVGSQGVGGVTFFNGTIVNQTTDSSGNGVAVTFGDDVRIDGTIFRTEGGGDNPLKVGDTIIPDLPNTYSLGTSSYLFKDGYFSGTVTTGTLAATSLSGTGIVSSANITDGAVATGDLADGAVTSAKITDGTIATGDLADSSITSAKITDGTIAAGDLASSSVTSAKITDGTIVTADLADSTVTSAKITDGTIAAGDIASDAVTANKILDGTITTADLGSGVVDTTQLANDSVDRDKINGQGGANIPIAYGTVHSNGTLYSGTSNVSTSWDAGNSRYEITITNEGYFYQDYVTVASVAGNPYFAETNSASDTLLITLRDTSSTARQGIFSFVVYKP